MRLVMALAFLAAAAGAANADEVVLRNGARFEGYVREGKDTVTVVMDIGTMTFKRIDVARIDRGPSALSVFDAKVAELKADALDERYKLALWGRQKQLDQRANRLLEEILARDPEHPGAREALGYRRLGGRWMTEDEIRVEKGMIYFRGEWVQRETADEIRRIDAERTAETARLLAVESLRIKAAEAEASAARAREEAERARVHSDHDCHCRRTYIVYPWLGYRIPIYRRAPEFRIQPIPFPLRGVPSCCRADGK